MRSFFFLCSLVCGVYAFGAAPPEQIPREYWNEFTWNGTIPVTPYYLNDTCDTDKPTFYKAETINKLIEKANRREVNYYGKTDIYLYGALSKFPIAGKEVGIIGSAVPWYEAVVLSFKGKPTTIEYNKIVTDHPDLKVMTVEEYATSHKTFDVLLSISSLEHDGLGRYGDPINPNGDILWMERAPKMLKKNGMLILSVPVGQDRLFWNAHRQYGKLRLPRIFKGWELVDTFGFSPADLTIYEHAGHQPIFVLIPE